MAKGAAKAERFLEHLQPLQAPLERYCRRSLFDANTIQDALQNAIATAFRDFDLYAQGTNFRAWIFAYVQHEILNANRRYRKSKFESLADEAEASATESARADLDLQQLLEDPDQMLERCDACVSTAVRNLPAQDRDVLLLHAIGEFKYREIADILRIPIGTVMSSLARCREKLRARLTTYAREHGMLRTT